MLSCRKQRTDEEDKLLKLLQGIKTPQDGFTTWCEQMLHALNTQANNTSSPLDGSLCCLSEFLSLDINSLPSPHPLSL